MRCAAFTLVAVPVPTLIGTTNAARTNATNPKAGRTRINNPIGMAMTNPTTSDESCVEFEDSQEDGCHKDTDDQVWSPPARV